MSGGHGHTDHHGSNKGIAILIAILAAFLAIIEASGKSAQTAVLQHHIEASNLWNFFQAKTIRRQTVTTFSEQAEADLKGNPDMAPARKAELEKRVKNWREEVKRFNSEPETKEGRRELMARAQGEEKKRALAETRYHHYEYASAALQLAIVLASASVVTGVVLLAFASGGLGALALALALLGWKFPTVLQL